MKIKKTMKLSKQDYFKMHFLIINPFLPVKLTEREQDVLAAFLSLEGDLYDDMFSSLSRKKIMQQLSISAGGLGNYLKALKEKGAIRRNKGRTEIIPQLIPSLTYTDYEFKLIVDA